MYSFLEAVAVELYRRVHMGRSIGGYVGEEEDACKQKRLEDVYIVFFMLVLSSTLLWRICAIVCHG